MTRQYYHARWSAQPCRLVSFHIFPAALQRFSMWSFKKNIWNDIPDIATSSVSNIILAHHISCCFKRMLKPLTTVSVAICSALLVDALFHASCEADHDIHILRAIVAQSPTASDHCVSIFPISCYPNLFQFLCVTQITMFSNFWIVCLFTSLCLVD